MATKSLRSFLPIVLTLAMLPSIGRPSETPGTGTGGSPGWWAGELPFVGPTVSAAAQGSAAIVATSWSNCLVPITQLNNRLGKDITQVNQSNVDCIVYGFRFRWTDPALTAVQLSKWLRALSVCMGPTEAQVEIVMGAAAFNIATVQAGNTASGALTLIGATGNNGRDGWARFTSPVRFTTNQLSALKLVSLEASITAPADYTIAFDAMLYDNERFSSDDFIIDGCKDGVSVGPIGLRATFRSFLGVADKRAADAVSKSNAVAGTGVFASVRNMMGL